MFYLVLENSNCREYISEKVWIHGFDEKRLPIYGGASKTDCQQMLPPHSYIHIDDFPTLNELATYLIFLTKHPSKYYDYFKWHRKYQITHHHGMGRFKAQFLCLLCQALNYNERDTYKTVNVQEFWNISRDCKTNSQARIFRRTMKRKAQHSNTENFKF